MFLQTHTASKTNMIRQFYPQSGSVSKGLRKQMLKTLEFADIYIYTTFTRYLKSAKQISARVDRQQKRPNMCYRIAGYTAMLDSPSGGRE